MTQMVVGAAAISIGYRGKRREGVVVVVVAVDEEAIVNTKELKEQKVVEK